MVYYSIYPSFSGVLFTGTVVSLPHRADWYEITCISIVGWLYIFFMAVLFYGLALSVIHLILSDDNQLSVADHLPADG